MSFTDLDEYKLTTPPVSLIVDFRFMPTEDVKRYGEWYFKAIPSRISELQTTVRRWNESWSADCSPHSLNVLGAWFDSHIERRESTREDLDRIRANLKFEVEIPNGELTSRAVSIVLDVSMYLGQVAVKNVPTARWEQRMRDKNAAYYGEPIVIADGKIAMNPYMSVQARGYSLIRNSPSKRGLYDMFRNWESIKASKSAAD